MNQQDKPDERGKRDAGTIVREPVGLSEIGGETAARLPEDDIGIELPIEENDFNSQPQ
jgi:hypothetical protein